MEGKYLGIQRYRFYIKCSSCSRPVTFLTDPKNADYEMESGGTRNYEVWHDEKATNQKFEEQAEEEEKMDSMKALENRVLESQREMAELDALEEIRAMNARHVGLMKGGKRSGGELDAAQAVLMARDGVGKHDEVELNEVGLTNEEEDLVKSIKFGATSPDGNGNVGSIHRLDEEDELLAETQRQKEAKAFLQSSKSSSNGNGADDFVKKKMNVPIFKVKRKKRKDGDKYTAAGNSDGRNDAALKRIKNAAEKKCTTTHSPKSPPVTENNVKSNNDASDDGSGGALSGLLGYGSDSNSD